MSQVEWNDEMGRLEVALRAAPEAVERALSIYFGAEVRLDAEDPKLERRLVRYLRDTFVVETGDETPQGEPSRAPIEWVGFELESHRLVWLYFEMPLESLEAARLSVRLFYEIEPRQLHVVRLRKAEGQKAWTLTPENPSIRLAPPTASEN